MAFDHGIWKKETNTNLLPFRGLLSIADIGQKEVDAFYGGRPPPPPPEEGRLRP